MARSSWLASLALTLTIGGVAACEEEPPAAPTDTSRQTTPAAPAATQTTAEDLKNESTAADTREGNTSNLDGQQNIVVTRVIDGDTFEARGLGEGPVPNREVDVRMLEINTVEEGECGYEAATDKLASLLGERVTVERDQELKDQYGRWLLYVWSGGTFVNHEMVKTGYAEAVLYEPNDKYWEEINAADTSDTYTPWPPCHTPEPPQDEQEPAEEEAGSYPVPPPPPDRDCSEIDATDFQVRPGDPHRFDRDGDGIGCES